MRDEVYKEALQFHPMVLNVYPEVSVKVKSIEGCRHTAIYAESWEILWEEVKQVWERYVEKIERDGEITGVRKDTEPSYRVLVLNHPSVYHGTDVDFKDSKVLISRCKGLEYLYNTWKDAWESLPRCKNTGEESGMDEDIQEIVKTFPDWMKGLYNRLMLDEVYYGPLIREHPAVHSMGSTGRNHVYLTGYYLLDGDFVREVEGETMQELYEKIKNLTEPSLEDIQEKYPGVEKLDITGSCPTAHLNPYWARLAGSDKWTNSFEEIIDNLERIKKKVEEDKEYRNILIREGHPPSDHYHMGVSIGRRMITGTTWKELWEKVKTYKDMNRTIRVLQMDIDSAAADLIQEGDSDLSRRNIINKLTKWM